MRVQLASEPAPGRPVNEDAAFASAGLVGVLDGVSAPTGVDTGCRHGPAWYVERLAHHLVSRHEENMALPLAGLLADAIRAVGADHYGRCDLDNPGTPASTVCLLKHQSDHVEYLVLCDSPLVLDLDGNVDVITDDRLDKVIGPLRDRALTGESALDSAEHLATVRRIIGERQRFTNQPGGYWIAAANPAAAHEAVTGTAPLHGPQRLRRAALLTDGASAAVDQYKLFDWAGLLDVLTNAGPRDLIRRVRDAEAGDRDGRVQPRYKRHDDASAALCLFEEDQP